MVSKKEGLLSAKRTHLAQKRTELAHERTVMSYLRTATTLVLFGMAFLGFSKVRGDLFYVFALFSIVGGVILFIFTGENYFRHKKHIESIKQHFLAEERKLVRKVHKRKK